MFCLHPEPPETPVAQDRAVCIYPNGTWDDGFHVDTVDKAWICEWTGKTHTQLESLKCGVSNILYGHLIKVQMSQG